MKIEIQFEEDGVIHLQGQNLAQTLMFSYGQREQFEPFIAKEFPTQTQLYLLLIELGKLIQAKLPESQLSADSESSDPEVITISNRRDPILKFLSMPIDQALDLNSRCNQGVKSFCGRQKLYSVYDFIARFEEFKSGKHIGPRTVTNVIAALEALDLRFAAEIRLTAGIEREVEKLSVKKNPLLLYSHTELLDFPEKVMKILKSRVSSLPIRSSEIKADAVKRGYIYIWQLATAFLENGRGFRKSIADKALKRAHPTLSSRMKFHDSVMRELQNSAES